MSALNDRASYRWLTITLAVAAGVYAWYALSQYERFNDLNQRQLSNAGTELKISLDDTLETVKQFTLTLEQSARKTAVKGDGNPPQVCDFVRTQPYLELRECETNGRADHVKWLSPSVQWEINPVLMVKVGDSSAFRYRIDRLMQELAFPDSFELIFVANAKGEVLYQDAPPQRRWLRFLRWGEQRFRDAHADRSPTLQIQNVQQSVGGDAAWNKLRSVSSRATVELGGTLHQLYLQPLLLENGEPIELVMGGAVPRSSIVRDALALGGPMLGILVFLVLLGLLGFPFVKLACLDQHERFSLRDIKLLYVSTGALLVLFTCASLALDGYLRWRNEADAGLGPLAAHLERRFLDEVEAIRDQLSEYDARVAETLARPCNDEWGVQTGWFQRGNLPVLPWPRELNLKTVAWIDPRGQQIWKETADPVPGPSKVAQRPYFRAVQDDNLFKARGNEPPFFLTPDRSIADGKFYTFVSMKSNIDRTWCTPDPPGGRPVIAAMAQLLSLEKQPLPAGYGFAVINREGRVLYHSDSRLSLRENLYEELSDGARVRAMTYAGDSGGFDIRYRERPYRFYLHPIALSRAEDHGEADRPGKGSANSGGFYLAVFRDTSVDQALLGHVFVVALAVPMALTLLVSATALGILALLARRQKHHWGRWLWPHDGLQHIYQHQVLAFVLVLIAGLAFYIKSDSVLPFLLTPFVAVALGLVIYWAGASHIGKRERLSDSTWQRLSVFLVIVCMVIVPSVALFRAALGQEFAKLILTESDWMRAQTDDRLRAARVGELEDRYDEKRQRELRVARAQYLSCVPAPFDAPSRRETHDGSPAKTADAGPKVSSDDGVQAEPLRLPARCTGDHLSSLALLKPTGSVTGLIEALHEVDEVVPIENDILVRLHSYAERQTYSPDGTIVSRFRVAAITLAGFALVLALLYWWIRWNTNHLFLADLDAGAPASGDCEQLWADCEPNEQMVLVQVAREHIANPYQRPTVEALLKKGALRLNPDVQPCSDAFETFLQGKVRDLQTQIADWQDVKVRSSWRHWRLVLASSVAGVGLFLIATQPGLQSSVVAVATGTTGILTAGSKLWEAFGSWIGGRKGAA